MFWYPRKAQGHGVPLGSWGGNAQGDELRTRRGRSTVRTRMNSARESDAHATASALRWALNTRTNDHATETGELAAIVAHKRLSVRCRHKLTLCCYRRTVNIVPPIIVLTCTQAENGHTPRMDRFHSEVMNAFSKRLKSAREAAGFETAKEFAEALGVEENRYRHWERGSAQPDLAMLTRITRLLKIEPNDLFPLAYRRKDQGNPGGSALAS